MFLLTPESMVTSVLTPWHATPLMAISSTTKMTAITMKATTMMVTTTAATVSASVATAHAMTPQLAATIVIVPIVKTNVTKCVNKIIDLLVNRMKRDLQTRTYFDGFCEKWLSLTCLLIESDLFTNICSRFLNSVNSTQNFEFA